MSQVVQLRYSDLEKLFKKIAGGDKPLRPVPLKRAIETTGMSAWEIRNAIKADPTIKLGRNKYDVQKLMRA